MADRPMRMKLAMVEVDRARAGRMACRKPVGVQKKSVMPPVGSHLSLTAKMSISMVPSQKLGMEMANSDVVVSRLSSQVSRLSAVRMPSGMPTSTAMRIAAVARLMVMGRRTAISSMMGWRVA